MRGGLFLVFRRSTSIILLCIGRYTSVHTNSTGRRTQGARDEYYNIFMRIYQKIVLTAYLSYVSISSTITDYRAHTPPAGRILFWNSVRRRYNIIVKFLRIHSTFTPMPAKTETASTKLLLQLKPTVLLYHNGSIGMIYGATIWRWTLNAKVCQKSFILNNF